MAKRRALMSPSLSGRSAEAVGDEPGRVRARGFTIVELLIAIVVIGILAAIVIVGYNGVTKGVATENLKRDLLQASSTVLKQVNNLYTCPAVADLPKGEDTAYTLICDGGARTYCIAGTSSNTGVSTFHVTDADGVPKEGACPEPPAPSLPSQLAQLPGTGTESGDFLGYAVAVSGASLAVVGAYGDDDRGADAGAAYVYLRSGSTWNREAKLTASDGSAGDFFGISVAIDAGGTTVVVGAGGAEGGASDGAAYVFKRVGRAWVQEAKLTASDAVAGDGFGDGFGGSHSVAISGNTVTVGAEAANDGKGAAYVFTRSGSTWTQQARLTASDGAVADAFGSSAAIDGETAVFGAWGDDGARGSAYVFTRSGSTWSQQAKLTASDRAVDDYFGYTVTISGDSVGVSAEGNDDLGFDSGSAYVFTRSGSAWTQQAKLTASDGTAYDLFGNNVSISGDTVVVGATYDSDLHFYSGSAYVFTRSGSTWTQQAKLTASDGADYDYFGSVAISGDVIIIGAWASDLMGVDSGTVYHFGVAP